MRGRNRDQMDSETEEEKSITREEARYSSESDSDPENELFSYLMQYDEEEADSELLFSEPGTRAVTAPPRPRTETEKFRSTPSFMVLEKAAIAATQLIQDADQRVDLDSKEGQKSAKRLLEAIEELCKALGANCKDKKYRSTFSQAYKALYKENELCYLTEILDSAQEGLPHLWVNGEKYTFSALVRKSGEDLFAAFCKMKQCVRGTYMQLFDNDIDVNITEVITNLRLVLEELDSYWTAFEQTYVNELMEIEKAARRHVVDAIGLEKELFSFEVREKLKGKVVLNCSKYNELRLKLAQKIAQLNAMANIAGKGRADLSVDILLAAETVSRKISGNCSKAVRKLAESIKKAFANVRVILRKYAENIEALDPQLRNNPELANVLAEYEQNWEKGKEFLEDPTAYAQLIHFSQLVEGIAEKYKDVQEKMNAMDTEMFIMIPCLVVLSSLDEDDKGICAKYYPLILETTPEESLYSSTKSKYKALKKRCKDGYDLYNILEEAILDKPLTERAMKRCVAMKEEDVYQIIKSIKQIAMGLQRYKPTEWNSLLEVAMGLGDVSTY